MGPVARICDHGIRRYNYTTFSSELPQVLAIRVQENTCQGETHLLLLICGKNGNLTIRHIRPQHELLLPLHDRHAAEKKFDENVDSAASLNSDVRRSAQHQTRLFNRAGRCNSYKGFSRPTWKDDDSRTCTADSTSQGKT